MSWCGRRSEIKEEGPRTSRRGDIRGVGRASPSIHGEEAQESCKAHRRPSNLQHAEPSLNTHASLRQRQRRLTTADRSTAGSHLASIKRLERGLVARTTIAQHHWTRWPPSSAGCSHGPAALRQQSTGVPRRRGRGGPRRSGRCRRSGWSSASRSPPTAATRFSVSSSSATEAIVTRVVAVVLQPGDVGTRPHERSGSHRVGEQRWPRAAACGRSASDGVHRRAPDANTRCDLGCVALVRRRVQTGVGRSLGRAGGDLGRRCDCPVQRSRHDPADGFHGIHSRAKGIVQGPRGTGFAGPLVPPLVRG